MRLDERDAQWHQIGLVQARLKDSSMECQGSISKQLQHHDTATRSRLTCNMGDPSRIVEICAAVRPIRVAHASPTMASVSRFEIMDSLDTQNFSPVTK